MSFYELLRDCPETYDCHFFRQDLPRRFILLFYPAGAPRFPNSPPVQVHGYLGKETRVQCDPLGNPTPKIEWTRTPSAPLPRGRSEVRQDGLYIKNTESEDDGIYTCIAANEFGTVIQGHISNSAHSVSDNVKSPLGFPLYSNSSIKGISLIIRF